ncbi:MAG: hypothetical protein HY782_19975 [Chloroflexi bacterium]|nr:hypothetical protein [Chloroflexota bacterium]
MNGDENKLALAAPVTATAEPAPAQEATPPTATDSTLVQCEGESSAPQNAHQVMPEEQTNAESDSDQQNLNASTPEAVAVPPTASENSRSALEKQPYDFALCTIQLAIQLLPHAGDAGDRPVIVGVRTHLDAPIVRMLRYDELGPLPPAIAALVEQLKAELPAREQAARERLAKAQEEAQRSAQAVKVSGKRGKTAAVKPAPAPAPAPKPSVLTEEQRANAVAQVATDDKPQLALF